jgi:hypothetical protein
MEDLSKLAIHTGLDQDESEKVAAGLLSVLKKSKNLEKDQFKEITEKVSGFEQALKQYERKEFRKNLPNPAMMLLPRPGFAPPGPPPSVIIAAAYKGIRRAIRNDKDAGNTKDTVQSLTKAGIDEEKVLAFIPIFILLVKEETNVDVGDILRLPSDDADEKEEADSGAAVQAHALL